MRKLCAVAGLTLLAAGLGGIAAAETPCGQTLEAPLRSKAVLNIDSRSAGLEITGTDQAAVHVTCTTGNTEQADQIHLKLTGNQDNATLNVTGGPMNGNFQVHIEIPRKTNLKVRMPAGQVKITDVAGNKDIDVHAGQITISSDRVWDYRSVDASVDIGEVNAQVYGAEKGGFFRTFSKQSPEGEYSLRAHVMTGQIELLGNHALPAPE